MTIPYALTQRGARAAAILRASAEVQCDGCPDMTADPIECDHFTLCAECVAESKCRPCAREHDDERGADLW